MNMKYGEVMRAAQVISYLNSLPAGLYEWKNGTPAAGL
jgi:hypothetical protein